MVAILAANPMGQPLWIDRNAHRSVLSACIIGDYRPRWIYPPVLEGGLLLPIPAAASPVAGGLVLTRPTYDGIAGDISSWISAAHQAGYPVVVDEAHGSHWVGEVYPQSAIACGADLVVHGSHKNEATLTQTGLLHRVSSRVESDALQWWWRLLATSSPSYLLLAALDRLQWDRHQPGYAARWLELGERMRHLWTRLEQQGWAVLQPWAERAGYRADPARLTLLGPGPELARAFSRWGCVEKVTPGSCTLFVSPVNDLRWLDEAVRELTPVAAETAAEFKPACYPILATALSPRAAARGQARRVHLSNAAGKVVARAITPYPPGVPIAVPGEVMSADAVEWIMRWRRVYAADVEGVSSQDEIWILDL
jgi:lysine decarboxylase